jgi:hypothetical protein
MKHLNLCGSLIVVGSTVWVQVEGRHALARRIAHLRKGRHALYNALYNTHLRKDYQQNIPYMTPLGLLLVLLVGLPLFVRHKATIEASLSRLMVATQQVGKNMT